MKHFTLRKGLALWSCNEPTCEGISDENGWICFKEQSYDKSDNEPHNNRQLYRVRDRTQMNRKEKNGYVNVGWFRWRTWHWHDNKCSSCWLDVYLWLHIWVLSLGWAAVATVSWIGKDSLKASLVRRIRTVHRLATILLLHLELAKSHVR